MVLKRVTTNYLFDELFERVQKTNEDPEAWETLEYALDRHPEARCYAAAAFWHLGGPMKREELLIRADWIQNIAPYPPKKLDADLIEAIFASDIIEPEPNTHFGCTHTVCYGNGVFAFNPSNYQRRKRFTRVTKNPHIDELYELACRVFCSYGSGSNVWGNDEGWIALETALNDHPQTLYYAIAAAAFLNNTEYIKARLDANFIQKVFTEKVVEPSPNTRF